MMQPSMIVTFYKPMGASNPIILGTNYFENDIPFGRQIELVPYNDLLNVLGEAEQREHILKTELDRIKAERDAYRDALTKIFNECECTELCTCSSTNKCTARDVLSRFNNEGKKET